MTDLIDTHCHVQSLGKAAGEPTTQKLWSKATDLTIDKVMTNAREQGVSQLICVGCDRDDSELAIDFAASRDNVWASIGIHPHEADTYAHNTAGLLDFADLVDRQKVIAVGECGLDYFYMHSEKKAQAEILRFQLELALNQHLPVIFHVRDAFEDFWPIFDQYPELRGVLHSFTDSTATLDRALERGLYIGVNGIATFTHEPSRLEVYKKIPMTNLLLETDSPFLTPVPHRGSINEPKNVSVVARFLSELRHENLETIASVTTSNARALFTI